MMSFSNTEMVLQKLDRQYVFHIVFCQTKKRTDQPINGPTDGRTPQSTEICCYVLFALQLHLRNWMLQISAFLANASRIDGPTDNRWTDR